MGQSTIALTKLLNSDEKQSLSITHIIQFSEMFQIIRIFPAENERSHWQTAVPLRLVRRLRCLRPLWRRGEPGRAAAGGGRGVPGGCLGRFAGAQECQVLSYLPQVGNLWGWGGWGVRKEAGLTFFFD